MIQRESNDVSLNIINIESQPQKTLGLFWITTDDVLLFNIGIAKLPADILDKTRRPTKREFLRIIMSVFDPLGFLAPFIIRSKILMQEVWINVIEWDETLRDAEYDSRKSWIRDLPNLGMCSVPRCYLPPNKQTALTQLHIFCDSSSKAYSAVAFWRYLLDDGSIHMSFIASKSRVALIKPMTIPRLELQAALLGSRLGKAIKEEHTIQVDKCFYWSDSQTVLRWIKSDQRLYETFVSHRLGEIADLTDPIDWRWVPSEMNPADDATRVNQVPLHENQRWFLGPPFLRSTVNDWPGQAFMQAKDANMEQLERRKAQIFVMEGIEKPCVPDPGHFSKWIRLLRSMAWVLVAVERWKGKVVPQPDVEHFKRAENLLIKRVQLDSFGPELRNLDDKKPVPNASPLKALTPFINEDGVLCVRD